ncbi:MAG: hypothetical protein ABSH22_14920 [Tepidisphaeraceae bacterium]|jgi:hypothetical protein
MRKKVVASKPKIKTVAAAAGRLAKVVVDGLNIDAGKTVELPSIVRRKGDIAVIESRAPEPGQTNRVVPSTCPTPNPGSALTFDRTKVPDTQVDLLERADDAVIQWLCRAKEVPNHVVAKAKTIIHERHAMLSERYNPAFANAIIACGLIGLPIPVPGAIFIVAAPMVAAAELWRHFGKGKALATDMAAVKKAAAEFWAETLTLVDDMLASEKLRGTLINESKRR